jgi:hypothetical protein
VVSCLRAYKNQEVRDNTCSPDVVENIETAYKTQQLTAAKSRVQLVENIETPSPPADRLRKSLSCPVLRSSSRVRLTAQDAWLIFNLLRDNLTVIVMFGKLEVDCGALGNVHTIRYIVIVLGLRVDTFFETHDSVTL